ncbi:hypothetical protein [Nocardiopsis potens]|uniref:hypothetical protein n=1 Tax=Nocardiopsis potens TaxID=1246458 RepID=UPI00034D30B5|nr:hypothetical protein [Nocardiopsis potens]
MSSSVEHTTVGNVAQVGSARDVYNVYNAPGPAPERALEAAPAGAVPVAGADPRKPGVHPARPGADGARLPPYVPRDLDGVLEDAVRAAARSGGAVLVVGDSTAGKSRALHRALTAVAGQRWLLAPPPGTDLGALAECIGASEEFAAAGAVVWPDDADRFLGRGRGGLTETTLALLTRAGAVVAATLRTEFHDAYLDGPAADLQDRVQAHREREEAAALLRRLDPIELDRAWSRGEVERAAAHGDDRLAAAARAAKDRVHGVAEYLAAGPDLLGLWRGARRPTSRGGHPRGHAIVAAAVDLARTGLLTPPDRALLERAHTAYLAGAAALRPEPFDRALAWAQQVRLGVSGLLIPADLDGRRWRPFDHLVEAAEAPVPEELWEAALEHTADDDERLAVVDRADEEARRDIAEAACEPLARAGHPKAMNLMGSWAHDDDRAAEAEEWWRRAAGTGDTTAMNNLGFLLKHRGEEAEAGR